MNITTNMEDKMSDSNKKYTELYEKALENKLIEKGFGEKDSHDEEHVMKVVCKHFDMELTDEWTTDCDHYIYEENTSDGYTVYVSLHDAHANVCVSENVFYYDSDLASEFKQAIYDNDHPDVKIYLSMLHDGEYWIQDTINDIYLELVELYTDTCKDELTEEDFVEPDMLLMLANNE
jgi:hypothetical protein